MRLELSYFEISFKDIDAKVRENTHLAMTALISRVKRNLAPYLKSIMGAWIMSSNDTYPTVASAAQRSFRTAFPAEKQENAIIFCKHQTIEVRVKLLNSFQFYSG